MQDNDEGKKSKKKRERKKKEKYFLRINGQLMQVTEDVYYAHYDVYEHQKWLDRKDAKHNMIRYAALDTGNSTGEEEMPDYFAESVDDASIRHVMSEAARECVSLLPEKERALIEALFFSNNGKGMTEREYSKISGIPQKTINDRKARILIKLKKLLKK